MNLQVKILAIGLLFSLSIFSCKKDKVEPPTTPSVTALNIQPGDGVFITDEGTFQAGNAKLSFYNFTSGNSTEDLFSQVNSVPLGDVCQSLTTYNGKTYIVVNNSGKIEVVATTTFAHQHTISGFSSPRFILPVSSTKAYVSDLYANAISIVNLSNDTRTGSFAFPGESEAMVMIGSEVFVSSTDKGFVYVVNPTTDLVTDSIPVAKGGNSLQVDNNGKLWVLCFGDYATSAPGGLYKINPTNHTVELSLPLTTSDYATKLCANAAKDTLYYLNYSVYKMASSNISLPVTPFITASTQSFYAIGIRPSNGEVFVSDAVNYTSNGRLYRYSLAGILLDDDLVGICPGEIYFY